MIADGLGVAGSVLCILHCALLPVLLVSGAVVPTLGLNDEQFHRAVLFVILPIAALAFGIGCRKHRDTTVIALAVVGLVGLALSALVLHDLLGESGERIVTLISATVLIVAHVRNYRLCRATC